MYLDRRKISSYNSSLNFIVLKRGYGKSYTYKTYAVDEFKKTGKCVIWLRRYKTETSKTMSKFFTDIETKYPNDKFEIRGSTGYINKKPFIYFVSLSTCQALKSVPYSDVWALVFDEFLIESGNLHYIPNECEVFCGFLSTVFRDRPIKAFLLGNKTKVVNPYNVYFNLCNFDRVKNYSDRKILVYAKDNDDVLEDNYAKSDLEKILKGTSYYDYNFKNKSLNDDNAFIIQRDKSFEPLWVINVDGNDIGIYCDYNKGRFICDIHCDSTIKRKLCFNSENMAESYLLISKRMPFIKTLSEAFHNGRLYYNDIKTKTLMQPLLDYID